MQQQTVLRSRILSRPNKCDATRAAVLASLTVAIALLAFLGPASADSNVLGIGPCASLPGPYNCEQWVATYDGAAHQNDVLGNGLQNGRVMAVSPDRKTVYLTGTSSPVSGDVDIVLFAFNTADGTQRWLARLPGTTDRPYATSYALALSPDGTGVFVTGIYTNSNRQSSTITAAFDTATGNQLWAAIVPDTSYVPDIATDGARVYVTTSAQFADVDTVNRVKAIGIAYDAASGSQLWKSHDADNPGSQTIGARIAVSPDRQHVYLAGGKLDANGNVVDIVLLTIDPTAGTVIQETHYPTLATPPAGIAVASDGSRVFVEEAVTDLGPGKGQALTLAYDANGSHLWQSRYWTACPDANCYTRPWYYGPVALSPDNSTLFVTAVYTHIFGEAAFVTIAYDAATGAQKWEVMYPHSVIDSIVGPTIAVNPNGKEIYITGEANTSDGTTIAYDAATGSQNWLAIHPGYPGAIAVSPDGTQVFVAGSAYAGVQTSPASRESDIFALAYSTGQPPISPTPTPTSTPATPTPTPTPTATASPSPSASPTPTASATVTPSPSASPGPSFTPTPTPSATVSPSPKPAQLLNISTRAAVGSGDNVAIGGFIISGNLAKRVVIRALGPSLNVNGTPVPGRLQDPALELRDEHGALIVSNDNWRTAQESELVASGLAPPDDRESAIIWRLEPGPYTAIMRSADGSPGVGLVEVYDVDQNSSSYLTNISTRGVVNTGDNVMIGGFIAGNNTGTTKVLIRGIGPSLGGKVSNPLADPVLELHDANGATLATNDNWKDSPEHDAIRASGIAPTNDLESAILYSVSQAGYTAVLRGNNSVGIGLVEIYNLRQ